MVAGQIRVRNHELERLLGLDEIASNVYLHTDTVIPLDGMKLKLSE
ncbi:MAG: hypothetical protein AB2552_08970 [Candidatus Thiodiazotropha endolucinida]